MPREEELPAGHRIARQGEIETGFFMIVAGSASVVRDGETLARLGPGDFFGELSPLDRQPRVASVTADEPNDCAREIGNLRVEINWSIESGSANVELRFGFALWRYWQMRGMLPEGAVTLERILAVPDPEGHPQLRARALEAAGSVSYWRAEMPRALEYYDASLELCREIGDPSAIANALYNLGFPTLATKADVGKSGTAFEEATAMYSEFGDSEMLARVLWGLGNACYFGGDNEAARDTLLEGVALLRVSSEPFSFALQRDGRH